MVQHALSDVGVRYMRLDAQVAEHGVRFPAAEEFDDIGVDASTQEGRGATGAKASGR